MKTLATALVFGALVTSTASADDFAGGDESSTQCS